MSAIFRFLRFGEHRDNKTAGQTAHCRLFRFLKVRVKMEEKMEAREIGAQSKFVAWLENYWYHYKWQTIIVAFFLMVFLVCVVQCSKVESVDMTVSFCGNDVLSDTEMEALTKILSDACPEDVDKNGKKTTRLNQHTIFSEEELTALYTDTNEESGETKVDHSSMMSAKGYNTERIKNLQNYVSTGECAVWLVSEYVAGNMIPEGMIVSSKPLCETWLYQTYDAIKDLPDGMMVILTRMPFGSYSGDNFAIAEAYYNVLVGGK